MENTVKKHAQHGFSQFKFTNYLLNNLSQFKLSPSAKLVLLELSTCYNPKNADVFPKQKTLAQKIGISERSVVRAIQELIKEGLILVESNKYTNHYIFTAKMGIPSGENEKNFEDENLSYDLRQNDTKEDDNLSSHDKNQKDNMIKEPVSVDDFKILKEYAEIKGAKNVGAYINALKKNGADKEIIKKYKEKIVADNRALKAVQATQNQIKAFNELKEQACPPPQSVKDFIKKLKRGEI